MASPHNDSLETLTLAMRQFAEEREWEQFHSPKNLTMALAGETAELLDCFRWLSEEDSYQLNDEQMLAVKDELADVLLFTVRLADKLNIDLFGAAQQKMAKNAQRYPIEKVKGSAKKYTAY
ncbi:nucleotide pyrophosphohydrolase [Marinomonas primoryensis]|mgnify:CR=1 FL=1|jgi:NTP pyrophosphatase (non-canonical NTP hydrolase)|uniref:Nucleotide pyrophosphohydrolase n=1 Tax=Marinomonas primoryensis TaxID=178399 RepID=A0A2Z4PTJ0_9GAMM|nr:nucleotide pyrophosphohydrolase [Marinomonas primoryensis]AWY00898.1 nucleotide pyrophosphohydrolase [Marinomonas primoryensis]|tara:strand:- start:8298 stop:8660 length:363 start_codon:yes stop_codon:yes gene_type:complete